MIRIQFKVNWASDIFLGWTVGPQKVEPWIHLVFGLRPNSLFLRQKVGPKCLGPNLPMTPGYG